MNPTKITTIDGTQLADMIKGAGRYLEFRKNIVDALNVFPVPDGDTGTNMSLTLQSAARHIDQVEEADKGHFGVRAEAMAQGALLGARGNSGVISSQILSGFSVVCREEAEIGGEKLIEALDAGVKAAYMAVMKPVKGTILTVSEAAVAGGRKVLEEGEDDIAAVLRGAIEEALKALELTPTLLPILKQAGVVDAGGQGFLFILEAFLGSLLGELPEDDSLIAAPVLSDTDDVENMMVEDQLMNPGEITFGYCTEFVIKNKDNTIDLDKIRDYLNTLGDCVLVVGNPGVCKVHVHTNEPGKALDYVTPMGSLHKMKIDNMREEMEKKERQEAKKIGLIAVACGSGIEEVFKSLGAHRIITGGQTMNPSAQDFLDAIGSLAAREIIILPNNGNVILAAQQAAGLSNGIVHVAPTRSIPQGIGAILAFNEDDTGGENTRRMTEAAGEIVTLEVTYAVRDTVYDDREIRQGQILGMVDGKLALTADDLQEGALGLFAQAIKPEHDLVTIYYGEDSTGEDAEALGEKISAEYDWVDIEIHAGGQPLYYYLISLE
ncbi:MAG: DAK2 domain-containing protein [Clostridiales bacterium]|nr:DAK2 domain-containing protein [Clostridiales bacterium]